MCASFQTALPPYRTASPRANGDEFESCRVIRSRRRRTLREEEGDKPDGDETKDIQTKAVHLVKRMDNPRTRPVLAPKITWFWVAPTRGTPAFKPATKVVSVGSGRLDQKGHGKPFGDIGHNWVADMGVEDYDEPVSFLVGSRRINPRVSEGNRMSDWVRIQSVGITQGNSEVKPSQESIYVINATRRRIKERRGFVTRQERRGVVVTRKDGLELPRVPIGFAIVDGVSCGRVTIGLIQAVELNHDTSGQKPKSVVKLNHELKNQWFKNDYIFIHDNWT
ncbi:hypothetical protein C8R44DRAFT_750538 [Mycena epipterygia]|nr:hypothetical protein C8R44DRAFT_750538 [Mycena epipterygia]